MPCEVEAAINADYPLFLSGLREAPQGEYNIITIILSILCSIVTFFASPVLHSTRLQVCS